MALRFPLLVAGLCLAVIATPVRAGYAFDFLCRDDTVHRAQPGEIAEFRFSLVNTGTERDVYEFDCRVISGVPGWTVTYCTGFSCAEPGVLLYDTLAVGGADTAIHVTVYTDTTQGAEVVSLRVRSLGEPSLAESIPTHTVVGAGIEEGVRHAFRSPQATTVVATGRLHASGPGDLFDAAGRWVAALRSGDNDVRHLPSGVYLVRSDVASVAARCRVVVK
ncbi:hypothetical protein FJY71_04285 [candidate division WOR-3 bacterium]|nr:hypothetical protein [candidate division WOR-3 bacterium]